MIKFSVDYGAVYIVNEYRSQFIGMKAIGKEGLISEIGLGHLKAVFHSIGTVSYVIIQSRGKSKFYTVYYDILSGDYMYQQLIRG